MKASAALLLGAAGGLPALAAVLPARDVHGLCPMYIAPGHPCMEPQFAHCPCALNYPPGPATGGMAPPQPQPSSPAGTAKPAPATTGSAPSVTSGHVNTAITAPAPPPTPKPAPVATTSSSAVRAPYLPPGLPAAFSNFPAVISSLIAAGPAALPSELSAFIVANRPTAAAPAAGFGHAGPLAGDGPGLVKPTAVPAAVTGKGH